MARLTGPLMSLDARGSIFKTITYSIWKGLNYARLRVVPYNPKSDYQVGIRETLTWGVLYYTKGDYVAAAQKTWWNTYAEGTNMSGINRFMKFFVAANYDEGTGTFIYDSVPSPQ
ncbi:MAG: hypothetical protein PHS93_08425 [Candidatus Omnitrophica bacterium]|nr:hypothetical protein [Candidatus Omnitrophota bacterium]